MAVLERDGVLAQLQALWAGACTGPGQLAFVEGEAGIGKTTVLRAFAHALPRGTPVYWGHCEALATPRPLAPLDDIALQARGALAAWRGGGMLRHDAFVAFVELLAERSALVVIEDLHWADEATLDLLRHVGRRVARTRSLLLGSFRNDELVPAHPLRAVLGDLATSGTPRLALPPLSPAAVAALCAGRDRDAAELHRTTAGNPFFVTEVLAAGGHDAVPATVQDAVLARAARLSPAARAVLDAAAVAGPRIEPWLLHELTAADSAAIDECLATGVLSGAASAYAFRHELARQSVLRALTPTHARRLHRGVLDALLARDAGERANPALLALHADGAGDAPAARRWAAAAAHEAARQGAHRQAAAQWALALAHAAGDAERAPLLDAYATECRVCGRLTDALAAQDDAVHAWRRLGDASHEAMALARRGLWLAAAARQDEAAVAADAATQRIAAPGVDPAAVIFVQRHVAALRMMSNDNEAALTLAREVLRRAESAGDAASIVQAHIVIGSVLVSTEPGDDGIDHLQRALTLAEARDDDTAVASSLLNLGSGCAETHRLALAGTALQRGIAFCAERDIDMSRLYQLAWLAVVRLHQGRWDEAAATAREVLDDRRAAPVARISALVALGRLCARRGEPGAWELLDEARTLATGSGSLQRLAPMHAARAEAAWIEGRVDDAASEVAAALPLALSRRVPAFAAELIAWQRRCGDRDAVAEPIPDFCATHPFALEAAGDWRAAAAAWSERGCVFEAALARTAGDDLGALREALTTFETLGARPLVERVRLRLRRAGVRGLPRSPRDTTRQHPAGLTTKEVAVLTLLAAGLRNKEIAQRLSRSARTVDHHVESIFAKLDVATRAEAVSAAHRIGVVVGAAARASSAPPANRARSRRCSRWRRR
ncbi:MAG: LuxR C-terminal-related transcriptional regulator [Burkholderiaceae bacterium]